jgi:hypothetical protein
VSWDAFHAAAWPALVRGQRVLVPPALSHPSTAGYTQPRFAAPAGQIRNWVRSFADGSRVHIHELAGGRMIVHRDKIDPARGAIATIAHVATETTTGRVVSGAVGFALVRALLAAV